MNEEKTMRIKASANYILEQKIDVGEDNVSNNTAWLQVKEGFISPEKAIEFANTNKIRGTIRVIRVASPTFVGDVVNPEPVYTLVKLTADTTKAPRRPRRSKVVTTTDTSVTTANVTGEPEEALEGVELVDQPEDVIPLEDEDINPADLDAIPAT